MKQNITEEQLLEVNNANQLKLYEWMYKHGYLNNPDIDFQILPTIGQMIEFLGDHTNGIYSYPVMENDGEKYLEAQYIDGNKIEELCDWLWEATKEVLEKEV